MQALMRGVGFEPTNPYGTLHIFSSGASVQGQKAGSPDRSLEKTYSVKPLHGSVAGLDRVTILGSVLDWGRFQEYVRNNYSRVHASAIINYARRYWYVLVREDFSDILTLSPAKRRHVLSALACLSKFLGKYDRFVELKKKHGVKIEQNIKISFQLDDSSLRELCGYIVKSREVLAEHGYETLIDLMLASGMRVSEAIASYNLIIKLHENGKLESYYRNGFLEHFRFESLFCRRSKNVYVSYAPEHVVAGVASRGKPATIGKIRKILEKHGLQVRLKEVRKLWASYMTRHLTEPEINLIQGRVGKSIFMTHYFNPSYTLDLKKRLERGVRELFMLVATGVADVKL